MTKTLDFIFDFASPNAYLCHRMMADLKKRTGAKVNYIPCLLGGIFKASGNQAPMMAYANIKGKMAYEMLETGRFIEKHKLAKFQMNPHFPVNTVALQRGALVAAQNNQLAEYIEAGLTLMWEEGQKMDDPEVFATSFTEKGFDGASLLEATQAPQVKTKLIENTDAAVKRGAFGIPTFYVGDDMFFGKERLGQVEEALLG